MRVKESLVREYVRRLNDEEFSYLYLRLRDNCPGDAEQVLEFLQKAPEMDRWLRTAGSVTEFYEMIDFIYHFMDSEVKKSELRKRQPHDENRG